MVKPSETIESLISNLESTVKELETSPVSLEQSLSMYEKTIKNSKKILKLINKHESKYQILKNDADDLLKNIND